MAPTDEERERFLNDPYASEHVGWYDRAGNRISTNEANGLLADMDARRVGLDEVGPYVISTVFLVLDHGFDGTPMLFETMVFAAGEWHEEDPKKRRLLEFEGRRYSTEAEAQQGHEDTVTLVRATVQEDPPGLS